MKIYIHPNTGIPAVKIVQKYYEMSYENLFDLLQIKDGSVVCTISECDMQICGIQTTSATPISPDKPSLLLCVENCSVGRKHYKHYNEYGHYGDTRITHYIYNDIAKAGRAIPFVYLYMDQFLRLNTTLDVEIPFDQKRFCLFTSRNELNENKRKILTQLQGIGQVDFIHNYDNIIGNVSCYHEPAHLAIYNKYKFIVTFENSKTDGYITEKVFNVFLAKSIPIYDGAPNISTYVNKNSIVLYNDPQWIKRIQLLSASEELYKKVVETSKVSTTYNNENWSALIPH